MPVPPTAEGYTNVYSVGVDTGTMTFGSEEAQDQQAGEVIHVFGSTFTSGAAETTVLTVDSDSKGGTWEQFTGSGIGKACIGAARQDFGDGSLNLNASWVRTAGALLEIGDTIDVSWTTGSVGAFQGIAMCVGFRHIVGDLVTQRLHGSPTIYPALYTNYDSYPDHGTNLTTSWEDDLGIGSVPEPTEAAYFLRAYAGWQPDENDDITPFVVPADGMKVIAHLSCQALVTVVAADQFCEPGGEWDPIGVGMHAWIGNYQFLSLPVEPTDVLGQIIRYR